MLEDWHAGFQWHGFACDFAAHRLFTQDEAALNELLRLTPMLKHNRQSQIYFNRRWMNDPLDMIELARRTEYNVLCKVVYSYLRRPKALVPDSFSTFVVQRYGEELYDYFFRPYTEKLFGIPGGDVALSWAEAKVRLARPLDRFARSTKRSSTISTTPSRADTVRLLTQCMIVCGEK